MGDRLRGISRWGGHTGLKLECQGALYVWGQQVADGQGWGNTVGGRVGQLEGDETGFQG